MSLLAAFARAWRDLAQPRVLAVVFLPMLGAIVLWSLLGWFFWPAWTVWFASFMRDTAAGSWLALHGADWLVSGAGVLAGIALLLPAIFVTAVLITELVAMPVVVSVVARRFPMLEKKLGGTVAGSAANAAAAIAIFAALWIVTLPLWLTGFGAFVLPALNSAYLNQRLFRYDALAEHASREEYRALLARNRGRLYVLGLLLAGLYYVPFVNLVAPVVSGLAFTHFCLGELERLRAR